MKKIAWSALKFQLNLNLIFTTDEITFIFNHNISKSFFQVNGKKQKWQPFIKLAPMKKSIIIV